MEDVWEQNNMVATSSEEVDRLDEWLREWEEEHRVGYDPMMINAVEGPFGISYARNWMHRFQRDGISTAFSRLERKPEPEL